MVEGTHENGQDGREHQTDERASQASALLSERVRARRESASWPESTEDVDDVDDVDLTELEASQDYPKGIVDFTKRNVVYIGGVVVVVVLATVLILVAGAFMTGCSRSSDADVQKPAYVSPYDWTKLDRTGGRYQYVVDDEPKSRIGVDVASHQGEVDWDAVAADGIDFAMIRVGYRGATEGALYLDDRFWANLDGARDAGVHCGVYFFSQARTEEEAVEEADYVLTYLNGSSLEYPIAFDLEETVSGVESARTADLDRDEMTAIADAFCNCVEEAGYRSIIYGNAHDLSRFNRELLERHGVWWAQYETPAPTAKIDIAMWQYATDGLVDGIDAAVDMNIDLSEALAYETAES